MSLMRRLADRLIFGRAATVALQEAEDRIAELEAIRAASAADRKAAQEAALAKIDATKLELRKTPRDQPRMLWPTPGELPPAPLTPKGPNRNDR